MAFLIQKFFLNDVVFTKYFYIFVLRVRRL
jgi:hypothetical protein